MKGKFIPFVLAIVIAILFSFLPFFPLWAEGRQITQSGESLYHELQFVSVREYYDYAQYARTAWSETTKVVYVILALVNLLLLCIVSRLSLRAIRKQLAR